VTVLFADVVRSMDIAASVDMERLRVIMTELLERSASVVHRYGGTVEYTGDGVMAIFGAPVALEDHAFRACLTALAIQDEASRLAVEVDRADKVALQLRVGLNSGRVIAGEIGSGSLGYRATGEHVGIAQRMESAAPPGGVMLSESTAVLVEHRVLLGAPEWVRIKGSEQPVPARRLEGIGPRDSPVGRTEVSLVGRRSEVAALDALVERATGGHGGVANVVGPPGIGKSRVAREAAACATDHGFTVFWTFCESHAGDIPFGVVAQLLRVRTGVAGLDGAAARARVRDQFPEADPQDLLLLDDLLAIAEPDVSSAQIDPDARRRRLTGLINSASLARTQPALFIIEDVHWIDAVSESMLADFLSVIPQTPSMVLITARPEYHGELAQVPGAQPIALDPLDDSDTATLLGELLGSHPSVGQLAGIIAERAAGNPFFAEEMVRELGQRGVLTGRRGDYICQANIAEVSVPATVQAAIAARIDRLSAPARRTINAASVIGARFGAGLLAALGIDPTFDELLGAELIDQVRFTPNVEYAFHHPLIHAVAYESQLKSDRAQWHRRLAAAIQERMSGPVDENGALIAQHLEAAGELHAAYGWHMRAGTWSTNRDLPAARLSWERARRIADALPAADGDQLSMRIAPRTMLCATDWQARAVQDSRSRFAELRELCTAAGDNVSLAIGMTALATDLCYAGRTREASELAFEQMALLESIGDRTPLMGVAFITFVNWLGVGEFGEILRWSQTIVDLAAGDPAKGADFGMGSPLAIALAWRGTARWWLGRPGWREDLKDAVTLARRSNPETLSGAVAWTYGFAMQYGVLRSSDYVVRVSADAVQTAERASSDRALGLAAYTLAIGLLNREAVADRARGLELMMRARDLWLRKRALFLIPVTDLWAARETARRGDIDAAIAAARRAVSELRNAGNVFYGLWGTGILVETLLDRGAGDDVAEAHEAIESLPNLPADSPICQIMLLKMRTLLARASGDELTYRDRRDRYRAMAKSLGFDGHRAWAEMMP
jgi:class 3 adenylate cyclase